MRWKPYTPSYPSSLLALAVGATFNAADLAGLSRAHFAVGVGIARTDSGPWTFDLDVYRVAPDAPLARRVKVDRWPVTWTGSVFLRAAQRHFPPGPLGHYPGALAAELLDLLATD